MKTTTILTAMLLGLGSASLIAQDAPGHRPGADGQRPSPEEMFKRLDKNGDGKIAKDEASDRLAQNFDKIDANKDGFITLDELKARPAGGPGGQGGQGGNRPTPEETFRRLDKNGDGKISKDEAPDRLAQNFDKIDANKDGFITIEELKAGRPAGGDAPRRPRAGADAKQ